MLAATGHSSPMNSWIMNKRVWHFLRTFCPSCCSEPDGHIMESFCCLERPRRNFQPHFHVTVDQRGHREINANQRSPFCLSFTSVYSSCRGGTVGTWTFKRRKQKKGHVCSTHATADVCAALLSVFQNWTRIGGSSLSRPSDPPSWRGEPVAASPASFTPTWPASVAGGRLSRDFTETVQRLDSCCVQVFVPQQPKFFFFSVGRLPSFSFSWIKTVPQMSLPWSINTHRSWKKKAIAIYLKCQQQKKGMPWIYEDVFLLVRQEQ